MLILLLFILELIVFIPFSGDTNGLIPWLFIFINFILTSCVLKSKIKTLFDNIIYLAYICRFVLIITNSHAGFLDYISPDSMMFQRSALTIFNENNYEESSNYANFLSIVYFLVGPYKIIGEYINVLFGLGSSIGIAYILKEFNLSRKHSNIVMYIICFSPFCILYDSSLLREAWVKFFIVWSILYFVKWLKLRNLNNAFSTIICVLAAAIMHGGSLFIAVGYFIAFSTYNPKLGKVRFTIKSIIVLVIIVASSALLFTSTGIFTHKVDQIVQAESFVDAVTNYARDTGRSAYLTWINPQNKTQILLYSPLKVFYFLFTPLPMDWRSVIDLVGFFTDSLIYFFLLWFIFKNYKISRKSKIWMWYLSISLFFLVFVFAYGTWNAGTAIRHRAKILPLILTMYTVVRSEKEKERTKVLQYKFL